MNKIIPLSIMVVMLLCVIPAYAEENYIVPCDTVVNVTPDLVFNVTTQKGTSQFDQIISSQAFLDYLHNKRFDVDDYELTMISPFSNSKNVVMFTNGTHKWFYMVSAGSANTNIQKATRDTRNSFSLHNTCGKTVYYVGVVLWRFYNWIPVYVHGIYRWNLPNGRQLNYWPDPDYTHVTINFKVNKNDWFDHPKYLIPLGIWHHAYIAHSQQYGYYWRF